MEVRGNIAGVCVLQTTLTLKMMNAHRERHNKCQKKSAVKLSAVLLVYVRVVQEALRRMAGGKGSVVLFVLGELLIFDREELESLANLLLNKQRCALEALVGVLLIDSRMMLLRVLDALENDSDKVMELRVRITRVVRVAWTLVKVSRWTTRLVVWSIDLPSLPSRPVPSSTSCGQGNERQQPRSWEGIRRSARP